MLTHHTTLARKNKRGGRLDDAETSCSIAVNTHETWGLNAFSRRSWQPPAE